MKRKPPAVTVLPCILLFLLGCGHGAGDQGHAKQGHAKQETEHENHGSQPRLALDNGKKWQVDEHTRASAAKITELVDSSRPIHSVEDARALADALDKELDALVKGCTMTGPAHDQLHVFLVALFPRVEELKEKTDGRDLQSVGDEIGSLLEAYATHFE